MTQDVGTAYTPEFLVTNSTGIPTDPVTATLTVTQPDQSTVTLTVVLPSASPGTLLPTAPFVPVQEGLHKFYWQTISPTLTKTDWVNFRNFVSVLSLADAQEHIGDNTPAHVERLRTLMAAATRHAEQIVGTLVPRQFTLEHVPGAYRPLIRVPHGPIFIPPGSDPRQLTVSVASVYPNGPSWATNISNGQDDIVTNPYPGTLYLRSLIDFWYGPWAVTYTGGVAIVNEDIVEGVKEILRDLWTPMRGLTVDVASQLQEELTVAPYYRPPPRAMLLLEPYRLPGFA